MPSPIIGFKSHIAIHSDSTYAVDIIRRGSKTATNSLATNMLVQLWKRTRLVYGIRIVWVRGHTKDVGNELADLLAGQGADEEINAERWSWRPRDWGYWEFRRDNPVSFADDLGDASFHHNEDKNNFLRGWDTPHRKEKFR